MIFFWGCTKTFNIILVKSISYESITQRETKNLGRDHVVEQEQLDGSCRTSGGKSDGTA